MIEVTNNLKRKIESDPFSSSNLIGLMCLIECHGRGLFLLKVGAKGRKQPQKRKHYEISMKYNEAHVDEEDKMDIYQ
jgi:hypothetical protein